MLVSTFVLLPSPCIKTTIGAQISGKVKCTSCVKKTGWKVGEEQKVKKVKESREEEKDREEHMHARTKKRELSLSNRQLVESFDVQKVLLHSCVHALPVN